MVFQTPTASSSPGKSANETTIYRSCPKHSQSRSSPNLLVLDLRSDSGEIENSGGIARRGNDANNISSKKQTHHSSIVGPSVNPKTIQPSREPFTQITKSPGSHPLQNTVNTKSLTPRHSNTQKIVKNQQQQQQHQRPPKTSSHHPTTYPPPGPYTTTSSSSSSKKKGRKKKKKCHKRTTSNNLRVANDALSAFSSQQLSTSGFVAVSSQQQSLSAFSSSQHQLSSLSSSLSTTPVKTNITSSSLSSVATAAASSTTRSAHASSSSISQHQLHNNNNNNSSSSSSSNNNNNKIIIEDDDRYKLLLLRSSEQDPSQHQITIPSSSDCLRHAKLCATMELYDTLAATTTSAAISSDGTKTISSSRSLNKTTDDMKKREQQQQQQQQQQQHHLFDFTDLVGLSRRELEELGGFRYRFRADNNWSLSFHGLRDEYDDNNGLFVGTKEMNRTRRNSLPPTPKKLTNKKNDNLFKSKYRHLTKTIVASLLDGTDDDLVVEGYYHDVVTEFPPSSSSSSSSKDGGRKKRGEHYSSSVQVSIFGSQNRRQFIVCYRGSQEEQDRPLKKKFAKLKNLDDSPACHLHPQQHVRIHPLFRNSYYTNDNDNLETTIFAKLHELTTLHPFCDVIFCGHSYGAALATIGAARFAGCNPMISVEAHLFGSTKVGDVSWRHMAHSLPNLKIIRLEHGNDPYVSIPSSSEWYHVGHTITINSQSSSSPKTTTTASSTTKTATTTATTSSSNSQQPLLQVQAFRFDERPVPLKKSSPWRQLRVVTRNKKKKKNASTKEQRRIDHDIKSYVQALEKLTTTATTTLQEEGGELSSSLWVDGFVGQEGNGVNGLNNEARFVV